MLANGIVMSKIIQLIQLWGGCNETLLNLLQKLQNRAARLVTRQPWNTSVSANLSQCGWLSVRQLVAYHSLLQVYKTRTTKLPLHLYKKLSTDFIYNTRLAKGNGIQMNRKMHSELAKNNFCYRSIKLWNKLPNHIKQSESLSKCKQHLKIWIKNNINIE